VSLPDNRSDLREHSFHAGDNLPNPPFAQANTGSILLQPGKVTIGMTDDTPQQGFHLSEDLFAVLPAGGRVILRGYGHRERIHLTDKQVRLLWHANE